MTYFRFQDPWLFLALGLIPLIVWMSRSKRLATFHFSGLEQLKSLRTRRGKLLALLPVLLRCLVIGLLVMALARPQEGRKSTEILSAGVDIILAIDTSASMRAMDFEREEQPIDRLTAVKHVVRDFIESREFDRMGMVVFGGEAFTQCPLTLDHDILNTFLDKLTIGIAGDNTAIGSAIGIAVKRMKDLESRSKVIILLTDGRNNAGSITPNQAARVAATYGIKIYTVGMGQQGQAPFVMDTPFGPQTFMQNVELDEASLKQIAETTGGKFFRATDADTLKNIYETIDQLEKSEVRWVDHSEYREMFPNFLIPAMLLLFMEMVLSQTRFMRVP